MCSSDLMLSGNFTSLRCGIFAGEALAYQDAVSWLTVFPEKELFNLYGPTEATVLCSHKKILLDEITRTKKVSIGKPNSVTPFYVLDEHMRLLPEGNSGRLFIGGRQVAQGYWNRTELSSERFVKDPFANDGSLMYDSGDIAVKDKDGDF